MHIRENIFDYVMTKLSDKIFPVGSSERDNFLFKKCVCLSWVKPIHFLNDNKQYVFGSFLESFKKILNNYNQKNQQEKK